MVNPLSRNNEWNRFKLMVLINGCPMAAHQSPSARRAPDFDHPLTRGCRLVIGGPRTGTLSGV